MLNWFKSYIYILKHKSTYRFCKCQIFFSIYMWCYSWPLNHSIIRENLFHNLMQIISWLAKNLFHNSTQIFPKLALSWVPSLIFEILVLDKSDFHGLHSFPSISFKNCTLTVKFIRCQNLMKPLLLLHWIKL